MGGWAGMGAEVRVPLAFLQFARKFELEADRLAARMVAGAGYDPAALARYIARTQTDPDDNPRVYSPLPTRDTRLAALNEAVQPLPAREYAAGREFDRIQAEVHRIVEVERRPPSARQP